MNKLLFLYSILAILPSSLAAQESKKSVNYSVSIGIQNSYSNLSFAFDAPVSNRSRLGAALWGYFSFSDRTYKDVRYFPAALAMEFTWKHYGSIVNETFIPYLGIGVPVGSVFIPSPARAWNNMIGGARFFFGAEIALPQKKAIFINASLAAILHFVFADYVDDQYSTNIDSFSGFGISAGYRF